MRKNLLSRQKYFDEVDLFVLVLVCIFSCVFSFLLLELQMREGKQNIVIELRGDSKNDRNENNTSTHTHAHQNTIKQILEHEIVRHYILSIKRVLVSHSLRALLLVLLFIAFFVTFVWQFHPCKCICFHTSLHVCVCL